MPTPLWTNTSPAANYDCVGLGHLVLRQSGLVSSLLAGLHGSAVRRRPHGGSYLIPKLEVEKSFSSHRA